MSPIEGCVSSSTRKSIFKMPNGKTELDFEGRIEHLNYLPWSLLKALDLAQVYLKCDRCLQTELLYCPRPQVPEL